MRVLIDTCVVIDALQDRKPFSEEAKELILAIANQVVDGFLTAKSLADIHYIMKRSIHDEQVTRRMLSDLFELFDMLDTKGIDCRMAIASDTSDFEDAIMIETAVRSGMDCIVTRNRKDYTKARLPVYSPAELLTAIGAEQDAKQTVESLSRVASSLKLCEDPRLRSMGYRKIRLRRHSYFMLYRIEDEPVYVDAVFHDLQDYENICQQIDHEEGGALEHSCQA